VEDDRDIRETLKLSLTILGYKVGAVANGRDALAYLGVNENPCLILLDLMMPIMDGWEFRKRQKQDTRVAGIPVVVITADGNARQKAAQMGAIDGIKKPFELAELERVAQAYCG
jgi:CheY-like chemotaxis protein